MSESLYDEFNDMRLSLERKQSSGQLEEIRAGLDALSSRAKGDQTLQERIAEVQKKISVKLGQGNS